MRRRGSITREAMILVGALIVSVGAGMAVTRAFFAYAKPQNGVQSNIAADRSEFVVTPGFPRPDCPDCPKSHIPSP